MSQPSVLFAALFACMIPFAASATQRYVAKTGTDSGTCTPIGSACLTITYGYSQVSAGDTLNVAAGTYSDYSGNGLTFNKTGTSGSPITIVSTVRGAAIIDCGSPTYATRPAGIYIKGAAWHVVDGFTVQNCAGAGIWLINNGATETTNTQILRNEVHNISSNNTGVTGQGGQGIVDDVGSSAAINNTFAQNYTHDNGAAWDSTFDHGFYVGGTGNIYINNISTHNNFGQGYQLSAYYPTANVKFYNNVGSYNLNRGIVIWDAGGGITNSDFANNIFTNNGWVGIGGCALTSGDTGITAQNNISFNNAQGGDQANGCSGGGAGITITGNRASNPLFADGTGGSGAVGFEVTTGSPAISNGLTEALVTVDFAGTARTIPYDIGAYEFSSGGGGSPPVVNSSLVAANIRNAGLSYIISATNTPTSFSATGLPSGLSVNTATGIISGSPSGVGTFNITLGATNASGTGNATLVLTTSDIIVGRKRSASRLGGHLLVRNRPSRATVPTPVNSSYHLVFDDEFNGSSLNTTIWNPNWFGLTASQVTEPVDHPTDEVAAYDPAQITVGGGYLSLTTISNPITINSQLYPYRTGHIDSNPSAGVAAPGFTVNPSAGNSVYIEARIFIPVASGSSVVNWPSFFTGGQNWPTTGEIDIAEGIVIGGTTGMTANYHSTPGNQGSGLFSNTYTGWHVFAVLWTTSTVTYYYDGIQVEQYTSGIASAPNYLNLQNAMGVFGGANAVPATMLVDYVHVYSQDVTVQSVSPQPGYYGPGDAGPL